MNLTIVSRYHREIVVENAASADDRGAMQRQGGPQPLPELAGKNKTGAGVISTG